MNSPEQKPRISNPRETRLETKLFNNILDIIVLCMERPRVRALDSCMPLCHVPGAIVVVDARHHAKRLGHDTRRHGLVRPRTSINELPRNVHVGRAVENFGAETNHAASETGEMLAVWLELDRAG